MHTSKYTLVMLLGMILFQACSKPQNEFQLQNGDLLFSVGKGESDFLKAIQHATSIKQDIPFSHVGIVLIESNQTYILEAETGNGVTKTPVDTFFAETAKLKGKPLMEAGRVKAQYRYTIPGAVKNAQKYLGRKYDYAYDESNDAVYCSELVRFSFLDSLGKPVFPPLAMSFKDKETGQPDSYWVKHFQKLKTPIPEGKPGTNPADMAKSDIIEIVHRYYDSNN
ncbi:MAG: YiiX/YebB-like N1pC/P60 family cysteine hydrolase [Paludibacteraceae bacterium]